VHARTHVRATSPVHRRESRGRAAAQAICEVVRKRLNQSYLGQGRGLYGPAQHQQQAKQRVHGTYCGGWSRCSCLDAKTRVLAVRALASTTCNDFIADLLFLSEVSHSLLVPAPPPWRTPPIWGNGPYDTRHTRHTALPAVRCPTRSSGCPTPGARRSGILAIYWHIARHSSCTYVLL
jgi:hypothetical protein